MGEAFVWTSGSLIGLGDFAGSYAYNSQAEGVSSDGTIVVGTAAAPNNTYQGFRWTEQTGMVALGQDLHPEAVADDGMVVGEWSSTAYVVDSVRGTGNLTTLLSSCGVDMTGWY